MSQHDEYARVDIVDDNYGTIYLRGDGDLTAAVPIQDGGNRKVLDDCLRLLQDGTDQWQGTVVDISRDVLPTLEDACEGYASDAIVVASYTRDRGLVVHGRVDSAVAQAYLETAEMSHD